MDKITGPNGFELECRDWTDETDWIEGENGWYQCFRGHKMEDERYLFDGDWEIVGYLPRDLYDNGFEYGPTDGSDWRETTREAALETWTRRKKLEAFE